MRFGLALSSLFGQEVKMQKSEIEAIYEAGALKLPHELPLSAGQKVTVTIEPISHSRQRGLIQWRGSQEDLDHLIWEEGLP